MESEGSGGHSAVGPQTKYGHAYGKYQILDDNIPEWTEEALGEKLTPEEFLNQPKAQDMTAQLRITQLLRWYKPREVAVIWLTGVSNPNPGWEDPLGTNAADYRRKFLKHYKPKSAHEYAINQR